MSPKPFPRLAFCICLSAEAFPFVEMAMLKSPRRQPNPYKKSKYFCPEQCSALLYNINIARLMEPPK